MRDGILYINRVIVDVDGVPTEKEQGKEEKRRSLPSPGCSGPVGALASGMVTAGLVDQSSSVTHDLDIVCLCIHSLHKLFLFFFLTCNICFTARVFCLLYLSVI